MKSRLLKLPTQLNLIIFPLVFLPPLAAAELKPNVIIILTDDQGYGELGVMGNPIVRTPNLDQFAGESVSLNNFYVMPVCSPTRAGLLTGRYYYRTGLTDTFMGRSLMDPETITLAAMLGDAGYRTGIFGKWHLGDNYPRRPMDKSFQEALVLNGGGLAQPGDPPDPVDERGAYFNAWLRHNGVWTRTKGYVSDVITKAAMQFIRQNQSHPFFVYLAFNCPHAPHQVPAEYRLHYPPRDFNPTNYPSRGHPMAANRNPYDLARIYGMIENIDDNVGRLLAELNELKLADNTIVVLLSDNGCQHDNGYNGGFRGWKATVYEGGIHQFCFVRWPNHLKAGRQVNQIASHIDVAPTLLDLCDVPAPLNVRFDGLSLAPLLRGDPTNWPNRSLFFQWHRGDVPDRFRNCAVRSQDWKLVQPLGAPDNWNGQTDFQLYDMVHDPFELHNVADQHPAEVASLKAAYDAWFDGIITGRDWSVPQRLYIGENQENPVLLTRQDWRGPKASWDIDGIGYWALKVVASANYDIELQFDPTDTNSVAGLNVCGVSLQQPIEAGQEDCVFENIQLHSGTGRLEATLQEGAIKLGVEYVEVKRLYHGKPAPNWIGFPNRTIFRLRRTP